MASDYTSMSAGRYGFYYGYEETICPDHGTNTHPHSCPEECEKGQWAFVAWIDDKEVFRRSLGEMYRKEEMDTCLLEGIRRFIEWRHNKCQTRQP